jgi:hypothetical protein
MQVIRPNQIRKSLIAEIFGGKSLGYFWEQRFLPGWLPLLLGALFGIAAAFLIANGALVFLLPLAFVVPAAIILIRYPFAAVIIWVLVFPYFVQEPFPAGRFLFWLLHRIMIPAALGIVIL